MERASQTRETLKAELAAEVLRSSGELRFVARGASMLPAIFPGDVLIVRNQPIHRACRGDVALWCREGRFYAHRIVRTTNAGGQMAIVTRGDALNHDDPPAGSDEFLGHVCGVVRRGKRIDLAEPPSAGARVCRFLVRRSEGVAKWLLRYSSLRWRLAGNAISLPPSNQPELSHRELGECL